MFWIIIIFLILFLIYLHFLKIKRRNKDFTIKESKIHNLGLFANKDFKENDIMIKDLFPYVKGNKTIKNNFDEVIIKEGKYINHCQKSVNCDVQFKNDKYFLICLKDIKKGDEIYADYDNINKKFNFIAPSKSYYKSC